MRFLPAFGLIMPIVVIASVKTIPDAASEPLLCYVGGTMRPAVEEIAKMYTQKTGREILIDYAESGQLLIKIEQTNKGDLYVSHDPFLGALSRKGFLEKAWVVAGITPVMVVAKGNPKKIKGFADLGRPGLKLIVTHPEYSMLGHLLPKMAEKAGIKDALYKNVVSETRGGGEAANAVIMGTADASIVWNAVARLRIDKLDTISIDPQYQLLKGVDAISSATFGSMDMGFVRVTMAVLTTSKNNQAAIKFAEFTAGKEASEIWKKFGFTQTEPQIIDKTTDMAVPRGSLFIHCAAGMRKAIDACAKSFEKKSGITVELNFDGSNRLLGQIKLTRKGDIYIPGDAEYGAMAEKEGLADSTTRKVICYLTPVIMVPKGNPLGIKTLNDFLKKGVKIGQGDEKSAAVGKQTIKLLALNNIDRNRWNKNVVLSTPTVNELGAAIKLGTITAAVVWNSIAKDYSDVAETIPFEQLKNIVSTVDGVILASCQNRSAAEAFLNFLVSEEGKKILQDAGYDVVKK